MVVVTTYQTGSFKNKTSVDNSWEQWHSADGNITQSNYREGNFSVCIRSHRKVHTLCYNNLTSGINIPTDVYSKNVHRSIIYNYKNWELQRDFNLNKI